MIKKDFDPNKVRDIVNESYRAFREKEKENDTKSNTVTKLTKKIEVILKDAN